MSKLFIICLYYTSLMPLWVSILVVDIQNLCTSDTNIYTVGISIACIIAFSVISAIVLFRALHNRGMEGTAVYYLEEAQEEKEVTAEYLLTYILPLAAFDFTKWDQVVLFLIFLAMVAFLYMRHDYFSVNVVLEVVGYRFYSCKLTTEDGIKVLRKVISRRRLNTCVGDAVHLKALNNDYSFDAF